MAAFRDPAAGLFSQSISARPQIRIFLTAGTSAQGGAGGRPPCFSKGSWSLAPSNSHGAWPGLSVLTRLNSERPAGQGGNVAGVATGAGVIPAQANGRNCPSQCQISGCATPSFSDNHVFITEKFTLLFLVG